MADFCMRQALQYLRRDENKPLLNMAVHQVMHVGIAKGSGELRKSLQVSRKARI